MRSIAEPFTRNRVTFLPIPSEESIESLSFVSSVWILLASISRPYRSTIAVAFAITVIVAAPPSVTGKRHRNHFCYSTSSASLCNQHSNPARSLCALSLLETMKWYVIISLRDTPQFDSTSHSLCPFFVSCFQQERRTCWVFLFHTYTYTYTYNPPKFNFTSLYVCACVCVFNRKQLFEFLIKYINERVLLCTRLCTYIVTSYTSTRVRTWIKENA